MKKLLLISVTFVTLCLFFAGTKRPVHIFMAGDSTMALKPLYKNVWDSIAGDSIKEAFPERGWGQLLPEFFNDNVVVEDYAQNGRSSRTFIEQGWWQKIIDNIQKGDYVVIQFGHNDSAEDRPDRYTSPKQYVENLSRFVDEVKAKGGKPIICTSVVRRRFDSNGVFQDSHGEYIELARQVAKDKNVEMIDMYEKSRNLLISLGKDQSASLFLHIASGENRIFPEGKTDNTHFKENGARIMASLFVEGLKENDVKPLIKEIK
ncbi:lysophospholipase L1-like esterase [Dysgonomonas alginatilytica]|uniref:Lysophospholipase L1-like esterase n=1 Tax=Dysgonomonas alginatilytica TaxID=1605892 RepID=A0A2V3PQN5_9BACT|nr:rhamnogalacturonan acetylesterase [Dysgonomonas alginatilytica]PXV63590.1 lysophospholipase L1-like esterase [Dysgonomonas alginatilytica]